MGIGACERVFYYLSMRSGERLGEVWNSLAAAEDALLAASGMANAWYFAGQARRNASARRLAALLLTTLSGGAATIALALLAGDRAEGWPGALARLPLVASSMATFALLVIGRQR